MAIYTNYGRYLKAKLFKEAIESQGAAYMLLGLGNPQWDVSGSNQSITIAPYNTSIISQADAESNQFYDNHVCSYFQVGTSESQAALINGVVNTSTAEGKYLNKVKNLVAPFPCIWTGDSNPVTGGAQLAFGGITVPQNSYQKYYVKYDGNQYKLCTTSDSNGQTIEIPADDSIEKQYFAEMLLRGSSIVGSNALPSNIYPVGLLGAIKCSISFVKDIGFGENNHYTGDISQFWYGDRYWQIVNPDESDLDNYIEDGEDSDGTQNIYPHHLVFTATVNPRTLYPILNIDKSIVPRQIAIYTKANNSDTLLPICYRANEYYFNFGQFSRDFGPTGYKDRVLNFTLPCTIDGTQYPDDPNRFRFVLNDYIRGQVRDDRSVDRFGYVIGF
jgi:hypothetical protein